MENGQADSGPGTFDDLAQFLVENPAADVEEEIQTSEESQEDNSDESAESAQDAPAEDEGDKPESEDKPKEQTSGLKFKVPVKGEDGQDTSIEVDEKELIAGYQRHADYTRKTQDLANREREVTQQVATKLEEGRNHYMQQAQLARAAVLQLAGLKSPEQMAQLAQADPAAWVAEQQRVNAVQSVLSQLEQGMSQEQQRAWQKQQDDAKQEISRAWGVLGQQGIDKSKLTDIYDRVSTKYGISKERLSGVTDPALVLLMRDAVAFQGLKDKKAEVTAKAKEAPKLPPQRQSVPKNEQVNQKLERRFTSGKAKLNDLAAYIANNGL
jgi:hypothetical protein